jgi:SAM-dependent methyltransferase
MMERETEAESVVETDESCFDEWWQDGDRWGFEHPELDQASYARQLALLRDRRYPSVLEIGCGAGAFTHRLAEIADRVVAVDVAPSAIERARASGLDPSTVDLQVASIMDYDLRGQGSWDLVVMSETIYYLGWLHPLYKVGWLASELFATTRTGGRLLMANTYGGEKEYLHRPYLIDTYRDLFLNVGYRQEAKEVVRGPKDGVDYEVLVTLFSKPVDEPA